MTRAMALLALVTGPPLFTGHIAQKLSLGTGVLYMLIAIFLLAVVTTEYPGLSLY